MSARLRAWKTRPADGHYAVLSDYQRLLWTGESGKLAVESLLYSIHCEIFGPSFSPQALFGSGSYVESNILHENEGREVTSSLKDTPIYPRGKRAHQ